MGSALPVEILPAESIKKFIDSPSKSIGHHKSEGFFFLLKTKSGPIITSNCRSSDRKLPYQYYTDILGCKKILILRKVFSYDVVLYFFFFILASPGR